MEPRRAKRSGPCLKLSGIEHVLQRTAAHRGAKKRAVVGSPLADSIHNLSLPSGGERDTVVLGIALNAYQSLIEAMNRWTG